MKNAQNISEIEMYMAVRAETISRIKDVKTKSEFGEVAQHIDFCKFVDPDKNEHYFISVVHRGAVSDYSGKRLWLENKYSVTKEEGNKIHTDAKQGKVITISE